jgi:hypothetical protein
MVYRYTSSNEDECCDDDVKVVTTMIAMATLQLTYHD